jgi:hypothetical protein
MTNPFTYAELHTTSPDRAKEFYTRLFDWNIKDIDTPGGKYSEIEPKEGFPGGLMKAEGQHGHWVSYVKVADIKASTAKAKSLGATALREAAEVPEQGWYSLMVDPTGAMFGLWQSAR